MEESVTEPKSDNAATVVDLLGEEAIQIDPGVEKRVLRRIDWFLMPATMIGADAPSTSSACVQP